MSEPGFSPPGADDVKVVTSGAPPEGETEIQLLRRELAELRDELKKRQAQVPLAPAGGADRPYPSKFTLMLADGRVLTGQDGHGTHVEEVDGDGNGTGHLTAVTTVHAEPVRT